MRRVTNRNLIKRTLQNAVNLTAKHLDEAFQDTLSEKRDWAGFEDSVTQRKNGEVVRGAYRNIVDSSDLKDSQTMSIDNKNTITYTWGSTGNTPATAVFFGHRTNNGFVAGRDWITPTLAEIDVPSIFKDYFKP